MKRPGQVIRNEAGDDDAVAHVGEANDAVNNFLAEKLRFINADHFGADVEASFQVGSITHALRSNADVAVGDDVVLGVALVNPGLKNLYPLAGDFGAAKPANQFLALAAEHRTADHFNPANMALHYVH